MPEEAMKGPIIDALKGKLAQVIANLNLEDLTLPQIIAIAKTLIELFSAKKDEAVFSGGSEMAELETLVAQAEQGS